MICESCGQTVPEVEQKTVKAGELKPGTFYTFGYVTDVLRLRFDGGFVDIKVGMRIHSDDSNCCDSHIEVIPLTFAEAQAKAKEYGYPFPPQPEPMWGTPPLTLTLADLREGDWFTFINDCEPFLRLTGGFLVIDGVLGFQMLTDINKNKFVNRLADVNEAREIAKANNFKFPF